MWDAVMSDMWEQITTTVSALNSNALRIRKCTQGWNINCPSDELDALTMERARLLEERETLINRFCVRKHELEEAKYGKENQ
jgi:hypothetical protein